MLVQPFISFEKKYLNKLMQDGQYYWVSQSYTRGKNSIVEDKIPLLITNYDDKEMAQIHRNSIKTDVYAAVIDLQNKKHLQTFIDMLQPASKYYVYWCVVTDYKKLETYLNKQFKPNIKRYIEKNTQWRVQNGEVIKPTFQLTFGELYITLKWSGQAIRVKFDEIENI